MERMRVVILGNAGSGKSTLARQLAGRHDVPVLSLDDIAWDAGPERRPVADSVAAVREFIRDQDQWIIEGSYADLVEGALPACDEFRFLNPGVEVCVSHCTNRPWEPDKYPTREAQDAMLQNLIEWVRAYEDRDDEYGLRQHRAVFDAFEGRKREYLRVEDYAQPPAPLNP